MRVRILIDAHADSVVGALLHEKHLAGMEKIREALARAGLMVVGERLDPSATRERASTDYSEEAIPERDPAHSPLNGTLYETQTVDEVPARVRLDLAHQLEALGMSASRAAMVASL